MSMSIAHPHERKAGVIHVEGRVMAISHLPKRRENCHLQPTEWKRGFHLLGRREHVMYAEGARMASSHVFKGKEDGHLPSFQR